MNVYTRTARTIERDGLPIMDLRIVYDHTRSPNIKPHDADLFAQHVIDLLNMHEANVAKLARLENMRDEVRELIGQAREALPGSPERQAIGQRMDQLMHDFAEARK